ncbi:DUF4003 domain-containing protein [Clostridium sp. SHJSY1]|uniref:DUF4003 family protein n=1 Tax=Clostridium sp. SHJSY1 TaxID=2942483 RepID=UPI002875BB42|nr:DUF4003 family protein [Clostridium sp. SHJSY1]MDS0527018.1 DUF4003 domain-containing protein [Clostridium sp. SHJSY1]
MDIELRSKVDLFSENYKEIRRVLRWDGKRINIIEALLNNRTDKEIDLEKLKKIRGYLEVEESEKNIFSRRFSNIFSLLIDESKDYKKVFQDTVTIYEHLTSKGFLENEATLFSAFMLSNRFYGQELDNRIIKTIDIKYAFKGDNYISYTLLATGDKSIDTIMDEFNTISDNIKKAGNYGEEIINNLTFSLILEDKEVVKKVEKVLDILCNIKSEIGILRSEVYSMLGITSTLIKNPMNFSKEIKDVFDRLNKKRFFKYFMKKELKIMISIGIVLNMYIEEVKADLIDISFNDKINMYLALEECLVFTICDIN